MISSIGGGGCGGAIFFNGRNDVGLAVGHDFKNQNSERIEQCSCKVVIERKV